MKIYLASNRTKAIKSYQIIADWLKKENHQVKSELIAKASKLLKVDKFDIVILEVAKSDKIVHKFIFEALIQSKPVLLLYKYHARRPRNLNFPLEKKMLKHLTIKGYVPSQLPQILEKFFFELEKGLLDRFNFFITKDIEEYLDWIPYSQAKTKSDFIRNLIRDQMKKDQKYNAQKKKVKK